MPRRRPHHLRRPDPAPGTPHTDITGLSHRANAAIRHVEDRHLWPGATAKALAKWRELLDRPGRWLNGDAVISPGLEPESDRDTLLDVTRLLPPGPRRELERLLKPLDDDFHRRTTPQVLNGGEDLTRWWWHRDREL
ncbi:hypothetical protein Aca07nite_55450 [Actinoplanes capillaceus]|uniref:Uncharacterized protein n=1 Tax=Actinoplanes campanulatus TaxID=113559 RepID=A0ABQ3WQ28_9ACTN|nr:hypothetical protein [Actinoplanes capillaceus]GID48270.1 hypothetical protein Aca07nite_55450 [Actinoplanes capillaceus]